MAMSGASKEVAPEINVTPMIDILLVLLIIFMVISPQKPHQFEAKVPEKPPEKMPENMAPDPLSLLVTVPQFGDLYKLNTEELKGAQALEERLLSALDGRPADRKAVFIKAPRSKPYGEVVRVIDAVKAAGGSPIGLQIEGLDQ
ncbi:MAG: ExbD/TolR family protein [Acidobacteriota bacterium]|jgi:biopolymer transport protein TolR